MLDWVLVLIALLINCYYLLGVCISRFVSFVLIVRSCNRFLEYFIYLL